ncbi:Tify [Melia azedarach]|uniref:Tify n=1 Tax=Melia azedarach TaxID=155640 RepID=A0ACC1Y307_MELAZ|nr:Tify [Melia azedarach]
MSNSGHKSSVAQTCNLLSQYLKENGRFADISGLGMTVKPEANKGVETGRMQPGTTMNLLPSLENSSENSRQNNNIKTTNFFPDIPSFGSPNTISEHGSSQMTIFYAGKVLVFNDFPAEKAKEIMAIATKGSSNTSNGGFLPPPPPAEKASSSRAVTPDLNMATTSGSDNNNAMATPEAFHQRSQAVPIARRASLHRFFEKRKDRATARAPYEVNNPSSSSMAPAPPQKPEDQSKFSWLEIEGQSSKQLDLKL